MKGSNGSSVDQKSRSFHLLSDQRPPSEAKPRSRKQTNEMRSCIIHDPNKGTSPYSTEIQWHLTRKGGAVSYGRSDPVLNEQKSWYVDAGLALNPQPLILNVKSGEGAAEPDHPRPEQGARSEVQRPSPPGYPYTLNPNLLRSNPKS